MWQQPTPGIRAGAESESGLSECRKKAKPPDFRRAARYKMWQRPTLPRFTVVPSAQWGLTSLFGMGRGVHPRYNRHHIFCGLSRESLVLSR